MMPAATIASASGTVATEIPRAPAANWRRATSGHLCVLACGRSAHPVPRQCSAIFSMLACSRSRSTSKAGVGRSALRRTPATSLPGPLPARPDAGKPR